MRILPRSPRRRRRLGWLGAIALALVLVGIAVALPSQGQDEASPAPASSGGGGGVTYSAPRTVLPSRATTVQARGVVARFVLSAVLRKRVGRSWNLVTPTLRNGFTRAQWSKGAIPVVPYPPKALGIVKWKPLYTYRNDLGYELLFMPKPHSTERPVAFDVDVRRVRARWLVSSWVAASPGVPLPAAPGDHYASPHRPGALWLLVPAGLFGLILLLPLFVLTRDWYRHERAFRRASRA